MDAVEFLEVKARLCKNDISCDQCEFYKYKSEIRPVGACCSDWIRVNPEKTVAFMEKWAAEHPAKTRQSEFLKLFPGADVGETDGCLTLCPCNIYEKMRKECEGRKCSECRKEFWFTEVENV